MSTREAEAESPVPRQESRGQYVVIARRYRPQSFRELVGQEQVSQALTNAITTHRVGHAYLFTGARGVGKTSTARILAKSLNCVRGPVPEPCNACDICESVSSGEDVDVLEIDGASNRGIDEIRQLRSNVSIRPSRARFKIYIIDEVHMLTVQAFNALLKTLEEPPEHVKFIFCTTDPEKIPITVLSRCQRYDFPPVEIPCIVDRLRHIVASEGMEAEDEALQLVARRAAGSLRDSQSLLEQLLSYCNQRITAADVHQLLGTAEDSRLVEIASHLMKRDAARALEAIDRAVSEGVDSGQLMEQLVGHFRDMMVAAAGCDARLMLQVTASGFAALRDAGNQMGLETILAVVQILDQGLTRMRQSTHGRTLLEIAIVRVCQLEALDELPQLIAELRHATVATPSPTARRSDASAGDVPGNEPPLDVPLVAEKKTKLEPAMTPAPGPIVGEELGASDAVELRPETADAVWKKALSQLEDMTADHAARCERVTLAGTNQLVVSFRKSYTLDKERCERPDRRVRLEEALARVVGQPVRVVFEVLAEPVSESPSKPVTSRRDRVRKTESHPLVRKAIELFDAEITEVEEPRERNPQDH